MNVMPLITCLKRFNLKKFSRVERTIGYRSIRTKISVRRMARRGVTLFCRDPELSGPHYYHHHAGIAHRKYTYDRCTVWPAHLCILMGLWHP